MRQKILTYYKKKVGIFDSNGTMTLLYIVSYKEIEKNSQE